jgi:GGDEF domain-containing protein
VTEPNQRRSRYEAIARLGRLERRLEDVDARWSEFRNSPTPRRLAALRRSVAAVERALESLSFALDGSDDSSRHADAESPKQPSPRDLVAAGRELEESIHSALEAWSRNRSRLSADSLQLLSSRLARAEQAAATLRKALRHVAPFEALPDAGRPEEPASPEPTLQALLDEIARRFGVLRRRPTLLEAAGLQTALRRARATADSLSELAASSAALSTPEALQYLGGAADAVRFPGYRDRRTGNYNERGFEVSAATELSRCREYGRSFGLILVSLAQSETKLERQVIGVIRSLLRRTDLLGRAPEGQLALGLPDSDGRTTRRIAARILRALEAFDRPGTVRGLAYAVAPEDGLSIQDLAARAAMRLVTPLPPDSGGYD